MKDFHINVIACRLFVIVVQGITGRHITVWVKLVRKYAWRSEVLSVHLWSWGSDSCYSNMQMLNLCIGFLKAHWWMPFLVLSFIYAQCRVLLARFACSHTRAHKSELIQYIVLHLPVSAHNVGKLRSLLEMKLKLVPVTLGRHLRCISVRWRKDRTLPALHYRLEGPEHWELL